MRDIRVITPDDLGDGIVWNEQTKKYEVSQSGGNSYPFGMGLTTIAGGSSIGIITATNTSDLHFSVCGMFFENTKGCICGARDDNNLGRTRASLRVYGSSKKLQWQFGNSSIELSQGYEFPTLNQDLFEPRIWNYSRNFLQCTDLQGNVRGQYVNYLRPATGDNVQTQIQLFGDKPQNSDFINCVIWWAKIMDSSGNILAHLIPYYDGHDLYFMDICSGVDYWASNCTEYYKG